MAAENKRLNLLRKGFDHSLNKWQELLVRPVSDKDFVSAFRETAVKYPSLRSKVAGDGTNGEGVLHLLLQSEFPTLNKESPDALRRLIDELFQKLTQISKEEFEAVVQENQLADKLSKLELMSEELKRAQADGTAELPAPLAMTPEEEMRGPVMEIKLHYLRALEKELEKARKANAEAEGKVNVLDARAKLVVATVEARAGVFARLAAAAEAAGLTGEDGEGEEEEDEGEE